MLALAQGPTDLLITIAFITAAILFIAAFDRAKESTKRRRAYGPHPTRPTGTVRVLRRDQDLDA